MRNQLERFERAAGYAISARGFAHDVRTICDPVPFAPTQFAAASPIFASFRLFCRSCRAARDAAGVLLIGGSMRSRARSCAGVSLIETMIAVAILAVGVLSLGRLFTASAAVLERANRSSTSAILASRKLEELRMTASRVAAVPVEGVDVVDGRGAVRTGSDGTSRDGYTRRWSIRALPADPDRLRVVHVRVTAGSTRGGDMPGRPPAAGDVSLMTISARQDP